MSVLLMQLIPLVASEVSVLSTSLTTVLIGSASCKQPKLLDLKLRGPDVDPDVDVDADIYVDLDVDTDSRH